MKETILKIWLICGALSPIPTSCVMDKITHQAEQQNTGIEIAFDTPLRMRGPISHLESLNNYSVWGWYKGTATDPSTNVFDAKTIDGQTGSYNGTQYWIENKTYNFFALHPADLTNPPTSTTPAACTSVSCSQDGTITIKGFDTSLGRASKAIDLMTASAKGLSYTIGSPAKPVSLSFTHELTWVEFQVATEKPVTVNYIKLTGVNYKGDITITADKTSPSTWSATTQSALDGPFVQNNIAINKINSMTPLLGGILLLPPDDNLTGAVFEMKWTYLDPVESRIVKVPLEQIGQNKWERGKRYLYSATIPPTPVDITLNVSVKPWKVKDVEVTL